jgi:hypothetical protein
MKAWRMYGVGDMRLDDIPAPEVIAGNAACELHT